MHFYISIGRQDHDLEAYCGISSLTGGYDTFSSWLKKQRQQWPAYDDCLANFFKLYGKENLSWTIACEDKDASLERAQEACLAAVDLRYTKEELRGLNTAPSPLDLRLPPEFCFFCRSCNKVRVPDPSHPWRHTLPWAHEAIRYSASHSKLQNSLLGPELRTEVLSQYASSNAATAKLLGMDRLFPDPEPDWEPFLGLTPETAYGIASQLEPDFARARLAEFDTHPRHYLLREQRIVHDALHDAVMPAPAKPFIRQKPSGPKLSVLTLTYNHTAYIRECIESVLAQQVDFPIQHIIADDGSNDGTQDIVLEYAAKHSHIIPVFYKEHKGSNRNVHNLFDFARSPYVSLCDGDDYFTDPLKLQTQVDFLEANPDCAVCFHPVRVTYEDDPSRERIYPPLEELPKRARPFYYLSDLIRCNFIQTNSVVYRWRFKDGLPDWFDPSLCPGDWYWHLLHAETGKIGFINKIMSVYRRHKSSIYWLAEVDRLKHRTVVGQAELKMYDTVNRHFEGKYESVLLDLACGVFADCLLYANETDDFEVFNKICDLYPHFAKEVLRRLKMEKAPKA